MMFNPIVASDNIKESFIDYITTSFDFQDETYARELREELILLFRGKRHAVASHVYPKRR